MFTEEKIDKETIDSKVKILNRYLNRMKVKDEQMKAKPSYWINHTLAIEFTSMTGRSLNNINSPAVRTAVVSHLFYGFKNQARPGGGGGGGGGEWDTNIPTILPPRYQYTS